MFSENPFVNKINKITFWILLPTIIIMSVIETGPYQKGNIIVYTTEVVNNQYFTMTFGFNRKLYSASSKLIKDVDLDSCYLIYKENAYGLKLNKKMIFVRKEVRDTVKISMITKQFFPVDF